MSALRLEEIVQEVFHVRLGERRFHKFEIVRQRRRRSLLRRRMPLPLNPNSEMGVAAGSQQSIIAVRRKAVLKHTQSKRWREAGCGPVCAKRLDCVRFIAALSRPYSSPDPLPNPA